MFVGLPLAVTDQYTNGARLCCKGIEENHKPGCWPGDAFCVPLVYVQALKHPE